MELTHGANGTDNQDKCISWDPVSFKNRQMKCLECSTTLTDNATTVNQYFLINDTANIINKTECIVFENAPGTCTSYDVQYDAVATHPEAGSHPGYDFGKFFMNTFKCLSC